MISDSTLRESPAPEPSDSPARIAPREPMWMLKVYVAGQAPKSLLALANLKRICEEHLEGVHAIEVVDLVKYPERAIGDQIIAIPTVVREMPTPSKRIIGDLSNTARVLACLDLQIRAEPFGWRLVK